MNNCTFTGYLTEDPRIDNDDGPSHCLFKMVTYEYRKNRNGEKKRYPTILSFEAWHTGADTIAKLAKKGTKMTVFSSARNADEHSTFHKNDIVFRVNEFDFGCLDKE